MGSSLYVAPNRIEGLPLLSTQQMRVLSELYEKLKRKLTIEQRKPSGSQSKVSRSQSVREMSIRPKLSTTSAVVLRPRAGTEIIIERRRYSKSLSTPSTTMDNTSKTSSHKLSRQSTCSTDSARRCRADSAPSAPFMPARRLNPSHLSLISTGSILAPTYRSRTATLGKPATVVRVTVE